MRPRVDSSWIDVVVGDNRTFVVRDHGQLRHVVSELPDPGHQYPMLSIFIGRREKDITLQVLFPHNNIRRSRSTSSIGLRADILTAETEAPVLFADGDLVAGARYLSNPPRTTDHTVAWGSLPAQKALRMVYSRLLFTFADLVCIFGDDYPDLIDVAQFLVDCVKTPPVCGLPITARPRVVVLVQGHPGSSQTNGVEINFFKKLGEADITQVSQWFSAVNLIHLDHQATGSTKYERLKSWIRKYRHETQATRQECWARYNALHLEAFFASAVSSLASCTEASFDFVLATRQGLPVTPGLSHHISQYLEVGSQARCKLDTLLSTIASALLMDHYIPGMPFLEPRAVFHTLYRQAANQAFCGFRGFRDKELVGDPISQLESRFVSQLQLLVSRGQSSLDFRREQLVALSHELGPVQSDRVCLYCLVRPAQHSLACHHAVCDICPQLFGTPASYEEYQFTMPLCLLCLSRATLVVNVLPPTMNPTILAIDGGGVRGGIPLEFLLLIQEYLGPDCKIQDVVDLSVGSSSGKGPDFLTSVAGGLIVLGLNAMGWDVPKCSDVFDRLARRVFSQRRQPAISWVFHLILGRDSILGNTAKWLSWLLHDSCYDASVFDTCLREAFGEQRRIFDAVSHGSSPQLNSRSRFGVVAATIAKETKSFVFGNFNAVDWFSKERSYELFRAKCASSEPSLWEVARATAAAPFYFSTAYLRDIGTFQDGGLQDNFAAGIARRISRRIWPSRPGIARLISMGTGKVESSPERSPHYRHVFYDSFLRRGFDAWMSNLDTHSKWLHMMDEVDDRIKEDYLRFDVSLKDIPSAIDNAEAMDDYRNLVILQPGSSRMARQAATALLIARFFFVVDKLPREEPSGPQIRYHGSIRCKGPTMPVLEALLRLHSQEMEFVTDTTTLVYCPNVNRLYGSQEIYSRITEDERKDLIQLLICVNALAAGIAKEQGIARTAQSNAIDQPNEVARTVLDQSSETSDSDDDRIEGGLYQDDTRVTGRY
ncbi:hypothetical protein KXV57_002773 [Aspergillus fumigatus]|uniref:PNPLA domain-containing protein n=1 Tax=Aspergillus fumigatus TaxID=746128 RepID=A0A9P8N939_ASPFM|nr:hypothetical protein KXV57_002773 [Aspergillus fumigatus]